MCYAHMPLPTYLPVCAQVCFLVYPDGIEPPWRLIVYGSPITHEARHYVQVGQLGHVGRGVCVG